jgi:hypothetical protein
VHLRRHGLRRIDVVEAPERDLLEIVLAGRAAGAFTGRLHGRQEEADEDADDRDDDEEFHEREPAADSRSHGGD